jgi:hypothetical protein
MSEFKYACPVCGQHMMCDSSQGGSVMECPTCFQKITAPHAPASEDQKLLITGTKVSDRKISVPDRENAAASAPEKFPGAILVMVILIGIAGAAALVFHDKIFKSRPAPPAEAVEGSPGSSHRPPGSFRPGTPSNGTRNIALNKPAFAGSQENENPAQNGNDGDARTRWCAASGRVPQWWAVDLGATTRITHTQIAWEHDGVYQYKIETSLNNQDWATVINKTNNSISAPVNADDFSANGRYVRIIVTGLQRGSWASFFEFQAFGFGG